MGAVGRQYYIIRILTGLIFFILGTTILPSYAATTAAPEGDSATDQPVTDAFATDYTLSDVTKGKLYFH